MNAVVQTPSIKQIMQRDVVAIDAGDTVADAIDRMLESHVAMLPVLNARGQCIGVLTNSDLLDITHDLEEGLLEMEEFDGSAAQWLHGRLSQSEAARQKVHEVMSDAVVTVNPGQTALEVSKLILKERLHRLPVVDEQSRLVGVVSTTDLLKALVATVDQ